MVRAFSQFFNQEEIGAVIDRKADLELVSRIQDSKANKVEIPVLQNQIDALNNRIKHISVLTSELALVVVPPKQSGNFKTEADLNASIKHREKLSKQA